MAQNPDDQFTKKETQTRFEAALRGARVTGHKPKADLKKTKPEAVKESTRKKRV